MTIDFKQCRLNSNGELCVKPLDYTAVMAFLNKHNPEKTYTCEIKEARQKRSKTANDYFWTLCGLLAKERSKDGDRVTKNEVYIEQIKQVGVYKDFELEPDAAQAFMYAWKRLGVAWVCEQVDYTSDGEKLLIRAYKGSSVYDSKQMARLIDSIVQDCQAVGIETMPPDRLAALLQDWRAEK